MITDDDILRIAQELCDDVTKEEWRIAFALRILAEAGKDAEPLYVIFDGPPGHNGGCFVEVETERGKSVSVGNWTQCLSDGRYWQLGPLYAAPQRTAQSEGEAMRAAEEDVEQFSKPLSTAPQSDTPTQRTGVDGPDFLRISKSGYSLRVGWGDEKRIVAVAPGTLESFYRADQKVTEQWIEDAQRLCDGWNQIAELRTALEAIKPELRAIRECAEAAEARVRELGAKK